MKKILLIATIAFAFTACNKCVECENDSWADGEDNPYLEVCSDNFESKDDYKDYIDDMEDEGWDCKSDFWN